MLIVIFRIELESLERFQNDIQDKQAQIISSNTDESLMNLELEKNLLFKSLDKDSDRDNEKNIFSEFTEYYLNADPQEFVQNFDQIQLTNSFMAIEHLELQVCILRILK